MTNILSGKIFYQIWNEVVIANKSNLLNSWRNNKEYTYLIKGSENSIVSQIANKLDLLTYESDYYSIDTLFYKNEDIVPNIKLNTFWFRDIRIAFEHENNFKSGLYQEVSHLLTINSDLKVLVTYPNEDVSFELEYLHQIIKGNRKSMEISNNESFLIIFGYEHNFEWEGYLFKDEYWEKL